MIIQAKSNSNFQPREKMVKIFQIVLLTLLATQPLQIIRASEPENQDSRQGSLDAFGKL